MWPDEQKTCLNLENTDQETVNVTLLGEQQDICKNAGKFFTDNIFNYLCLKLKQFSSCRLKLISCFYVETGKRYLLHDMKVSNQEFKGNSLANLDITVSTTVQVQFIYFVATLPKIN